MNHEHDHDHDHAPAGLGGQHAEPGVGGPRGQEAARHRQNQQVKPLLASFYQSTVYNKSGKLATI